MTKDNKIIRLVSNDNTTIDIERDHNFISMSTFITTL